MEDAFIAIVEAGRRIGANRPYSASRGPTSIYTRPYNQFERQDSADLDAGQKGSESNPPRPSSIAVGMVMPVVLILLFGYGLTLDVKNVPVAVVLEDTSPDAVELASTFQLSPYFHAQADDLDGPGQDLILASQVDGIIRIRSDFSRQMRNGDAEVQILAHGRDANRARIIQGYVQGRLASGPRAAWPKDKKCRAARWSCRTGFGSTRPTRAVTFWFPVWLCSS